MIRIRRFLNAAGRHWLRLTLGAVVGLLVVTAVLVDLLIALESQRVAYDFADTYASAALVLLMFGCVGGALYAYARERQRQGGGHYATDVPARDRGTGDAHRHVDGERTVGQGIQGGRQQVAPGAVGQRTTGDDDLDKALDVVARARLQTVNDAA